MSFHRQRGHVERHETTLLAPDYFNVYDFIYYALEGIKLTVTDGKKKVGVLSDYSDTYIIIPELP